jgi:hypothetical protein
MEQLHNAIRDDDFSEAERLIGYGVDPHMAIYGIDSISFDMLVLLRQNGLKNDRAGIEIHHSKTKEGEMIIIHTGRFVVKRLEFIRNFYKEYPDIIQIPTNTFTRNGKHELEPPS